MCIYRTSWHERMRTAPSCAPFRLEGWGPAFGLSNGSAGRRNMRGGPGCGRPARCVVKRVYTTCFTSLFRCLTFNSLLEVSSIYDVATTSSLTMPLQHVEPNMPDIWPPHEHIEADRHHLSSLSPKPTPRKSFMYSFLTLPTTLTFHNSRTARTSRTTLRAPSLFRAMCGWRLTWLEGKRTKGETYPVRRYAIPTCRSQLWRVNLNATTLYLQPNTNPWNPSRTHDDATAMARARTRLLSFR